MHLPWAATTGTLKQQNATRELDLPNHFGYAKMAAMLTNVQR
jgi:hypothetical protein